MRKRKRRTIKPYILLAAFIIPLNLIGISYAYWNDGLDIINSVSTGLIDPLFCEDYTLNVVQGKGDLIVSIEDRSTLTVEGRVYSDYKAFINYCLQNEGTVPVKYAGLKETINGGITQLNQPSGVIKPEGCFPSGDGNPKLRIQADEDGIYSFEIEMLFQQWNNAQESLLPLQ